MVETFSPHSSAGTISISAGSGDAGLRLPNSTVANPASLRLIRRQIGTCAEPPATSASWPPLSRNRTVQLEGPRRRHSSDTGPASSEGSATIPTDWRHAVPKPGPLCGAGRPPVTFARLRVFPVTSAASFLIDRRGLDSFGPGVSLLVLCFDHVGCSVHSPASGSRLRSGPQTTVTLSDWSHHHGLKSRVSGSSGFSCMAQIAVKAKHNKTICWGGKPALSHP